jgi:hypothetical protein
LNISTNGKLASHVLHYFKTKRATAGSGIVYANRTVDEKFVAFLRDHAAKPVIVTDGIIGCPHEEGIGHSEGKSCSQCPYWAGRDRLTRDRIH